ncbi:MAG: NucA/NucB deoxyribonuclease domain-containing protein [Proteobacteria bacterium]|nr:NucA/NucB deoxyribonuclease domain-containing protein [Pseudomonadota bacterium]
MLKTVNGNKTVFIYDITGKLIEVRTKDSIIDIIYLNGEPIAQLVNGARYYFANDALGTPEYLTGQNGQKQWSGNINPFAVNATGQVQQDLRFAGQFNDSETGLVYNNARAYVPFLGRYLQADPLGLASGSLNNYVYVGNNPVNLVDPSGKFIPIVIAIIEVGAEAAETAWATYRTWQAANKVAKLAERIASKEQANAEGKVCAGDQKTVEISKSKYPEAAEHIIDAQESGYPSTLTIDRAAAKANRRASLRDYPTRTGFDRDEYPGAMFSEGGEGASVRYIDPKDNRGAGACVGGQCKGLPDGSRVNIKVIE